MYRIHKFKLSHFEDLVDMFYDFYKEIYHDRKIGLKYRYYETVMEWIKENRDIILVSKDDTVVGFTMSYLQNDGLTEPIYKGEIAYVKPEYRKGRATYMLYNNVVKYAEELGVILESNSRIENGVNDMVKKHFNAKPIYILNEKRS